MKPAWIAAIGIAVVAGGVRAEADAPSEFASFLERYGCTLGEDSRAAGHEAGFAAAEIDAEIAGFLSDGEAVVEGEYTVLGPEICTIRLPEVSTDWAFDDPRIVAITSDIAPSHPDEPEGCFLGGLSELFQTAYPDVNDETGMREFTRFVASGFMSGDLRFYSPDPLRTPPTFQLMTGKCAQLPYLEDIERAASFVNDTDFDRYIRAIGADTPCSRQTGSLNAMAISAEIQGVDLATGEEPEEPINAWLWFEYDLIGWAAGWRVNMTWEERGTLRPPMCTYGNR